MATNKNPRKRQRKKATKRQIEAIWEQLDGDERSGVAWRIPALLGPSADRLESLGLVTIRRWTTGLGIPGPGAPYAGSEMSDVKITPLGREVSKYAQTLPEFYHPHLQDRPARAPAPRKLAHARKKRDASFKAEQKKLREKSARVTAGVSKGKVNPGTKNETYNLSIHPEAVYGGPSKQSSWLAALAALESTKILNTHDVQYGDRASTIYVNELTFAKFRKLVKALQTGFDGWAEVEGEFRIEYGGG